IAKGLITAGDVGKMPNGGKIKTLGGTLTVQTKGTLLINGAKPYLADQKATNGIVHLMDRALAK
ncbi:MAG: fasciclin domain-containing protein, partial [Armatimonadaceae bacterium]